MPKSFICGVAGHSLTPAEKEFLSKEQPYGVIIFARNIEGPAQVKSLTADIISCLNHKYASVLVDQEGGRVARLKPPHWRAYPPAAALAALPDPARAVYINARLIAAELRAAGITTDCAPVADVLSSSTHDIIGDRAFGTAPDTVGKLARAQSNGLLDGGVLSVLKHIPGHGRATQDSHEHLPVVKASLKELEKTDFVPFKALSDLPLAMTAHIVYEAIDPAHCATVSPTVIHFIRKEIGFDGLLMSDDLSMKALKGSLAERTQKSLAAGCDLVLHGNGALVGEPVRDLMKEIKEVAAASTIMGNDAVRRAERALSMLPQKPIGGAETLLSEWQRLLAA